MASIEEVIDLMVANGEPEEKIMEVVNHYNKQQESKKAAPPADAPVDVEDTASDSGDGSSESQEVAQPTSKPHITHDKLIEYDAYMKGLGKEQKFSLFLDKENAMLKNLQDHYEGENIVFEKQDELGRHDKIIARREDCPSCPTATIDTGNSLYKKDPQKYLQRNLYNWVDQVRRDGEVEAMTNQEVNTATDEISKTAGLAPTESNDEKIKRLEEIRDNEPGPTKKKKDAEAELEVYKDKKREKEFNPSIKKEKELTEKYNTELQQKQDAHDEYLKSIGITKDSPEWQVEMNKIKKQHDIGFGKGNVAVVNAYQGLKDVDDLGNELQRVDSKGNPVRTKQEIYDAAIANLKEDIPTGYGLGFVGEEGKNVFNWLAPEEEWKLLDGMSFQEIEELAGMRLSGGDAGMSKNRWDTIRKEKQVGHIQRKLAKQNARDASRKLQNLEDEFSVVEQEGTTLTNIRTDLDDDAEKWKNGGLVELENLAKEIENTPQPTTQEELKDYQNKVNRYNTLREQGLALQNRTDDYNAKLTNHNEKIEKLQKEVKFTTTMRNDAIAERGMKIVDGLLVDDSDNFKSIKDYENWRKEHKIEWNFFDPDAWAVFGQGVINTAAKYYTGTSLWALNGLDSVTGGAFSQGEERYTRLDALNSMYEKYTNYDYFGKARPEDYEKGEMNALDKGALAVSEGLPFMLAIMASAGKEGFKPGLWTKTLGNKALNPEFANKIRMAQTAFNITAMDNTLEGKAMGLNELQSWAYGGIVGTVTGMTQMIMPDAEFFKGGVINEVLKKGLGTTLKGFTTREGLKFAGKRWATNVLKEIVEEEAEMVLTDVARLGFGLEHTLESTDIKNHLKLIHDTAWLSGSMGAVGAGKDMRNIRQSVHNQLKGDISEHMKTIDHMSSEMTKKLQEAQANGDMRAVEAYKFELGRLKDAADYANNFKAAINISPENVTDKELELLTEKIRLENLKKNQDASFHGAIDLQLEKLNAQIEQSAIQRNAAETNKKLMEQITTNVKKLADSQGSKIEEFGSDDSEGWAPGSPPARTSKEKIDEYINQKNEDGSYVFDEGTRTAVINEGIIYGSYVKDKKGNKILLLNKDSDGTVEGANVAAHEFLHQILETTYAARDAAGNIIRDQDGNIKVDKKKAIGIGMELGKWVVESQGQDFMNSEMKRRLDRAYGGDPANVQMQEVLNTLSDAMVSGDLVFEETAFDKLRGVMRRTFQKMGMDVKFNTGKDVFNFIKDYNKTISQGKKLSKAQQKVIQQGAQVGGTIAETISSDQVAEIQQTEDLNKKKELLFSNGIDPESELGRTFLMSKPSNVGALLNRFDGNKRQMIQETVGKTKDGKDVFELKDNQGNYVNNPLVRSEFGQEIAPITETIAKRLFDPIPVNLRSGVTRGQFINDLTAIASSLVENEFDPAKQDIDKFISNRLNLRANKLASDLGIESTVEEGGLGAMVGLEAAAELTAEETGPVTSETPGIILLKRIATEKQVSAVKKAIKDKLPNVDNKKLTFKNLKDLAPEVTGEMFGISPKKLVSLANITKGELQSAQMFISKNADVLIAMLPEGSTVSGTSTGVPKTLLNEFYTKTDRAKMAKTGNKAGLSIQLKNDNISKKDFLEVFGIIDGKPVRTDRNTSARVLALANQTGKMITNQEVRRKLMNDKSSPNHLLSQLEDGKSKVLFSAPTPISQTVLRNNGKNEGLLDTKEIGEVIPELEMDYTDIVEDQGLEIIKPSTEAGKTKYKQDLYNPIFMNNAPEAIFRFAGNFTGTTDSAIMEIEGVWQKVRIPARNLPFINVQEVNWSVDQAIKQDGFVGFAKPDKDIDNALSRESYTDLKNKLTTKEFNERMESNRRGFKKIWKIFDKWVELDRDKAIPVIGALLSSTSAHQGHFMRVGAEVGFLNTLTEKNRNELSLEKYGKKFDDLKGPQKTVIKKAWPDVEEHTSPVSALSKYLFNRLVQGNLFGDKNYFDKAMNGYIQGPIPYHWDKRLKGPGYDYVSSIDPEHAYDVFMGNKPVWVRYINENVNNNGRDIKKGIAGGIDPNEIILRNGNTLAQEYGVDIDGEVDGRTVIKQQDLLADFFAGRKTQGEIMAEMQMFLQADVAKNIPFSKTIDNAIMFSRSAFEKNFDKFQDQKQKGKEFVESILKKPKGISVLDFDDTLATSNSEVISTAPDGTVIKLTAEQFAAQGADLLEQGYIHDFSEFDKVVDGKVASLFNKALKLQGKFGTDNMFVLTARPPESAKSIYEFLKANGLDIPLKNITGLGNSTSEAKALWIADKVGEGYNDFYFADDALQNVQAVKNMLEQFDVKSKIQQAKVKFSKDASQTFNNIIEDTTGIESEKRFSDAQARLRGKKTKYKSIIPASAQDFQGLLYNFLGKGKKGEADMAFFKEALIDPFARGIDELNSSRQSAANDFKNLNKKFPKVKKSLNKKIKGLDYTNDQAIRVYLWNKAGFEIPGLSQRDLKALTEFVENNNELKTYADAIGLISKKDAGYSEPNSYWLAENIASDLLSDGAIGDARAQHLTEWIENKNMIFSPENLNKIEAIYGSKFREALEDILYRMENGTNRPTGRSRLMNGFMNWTNNSVGAIMFFNMRSATLQTISAANYMNWTDNNPAKAALAFANQPQFWKDFSMIFNSDYLKQRRSGNQRGVNEAELTAAVEGSDNKAKAAIAWLLKKGFTPTQIADSFAISMGGATFYRNRFNKYVKDGMSEAQAKEQAWLDFQEITEVNQQSARPDMISQQQASPLGRLILAFQNTPMQYARIMNKATRDLVNGRGDYKTHISKIAYYGTVQSIIFGALQSALYASLGEDEEEEFDKKKERILNQMVDSWLTGIGYGGKAIGTVKNTIMEYLKQRDRGFKGDHAYTLLQLLGFSPPIGSKVRKVYSSIKTEQFNRGVFSKRGFTLDNPIWSGVGNVIEGVTNIPMGRIANLMLQLDNAMDSNHKWWERVALILGQNTWDLGIQDPDIEAAKLEVKEERKIEKEKERLRKKGEKEEEKRQQQKAVIEENKKKKDGRCAAISKGGNRCSNNVVAGKSFCTVHEEMPQRADGKEVQCKKIKKDGKRCGMKTTNKSGYCYYHD